MDTWLVQTAIGLVVSIVLLWLVLIVVLLRNSPDGVTAKQALKLGPDCLRLFKSLATDKAIPKLVRARIWLLLAYLTSPIDLVPDFLPVIGYADDVVIIALTLRSVVRSSGREVLARHWSGTTDGLEALLKLTRAGRL